MHILKKHFCVLVAVAILTSSLFGCAKVDKPTDSNTSSRSITSEVETTVANSEDLKVPITEGTVVNNSTSPENTANNIVTAKGTLKVHFLDVGQADSIFIELPSKETMLIDAGESANGSTVVNYIKQLGFSTITYLIATHPHADHIGGMTYVVNNLSIGYIYMPKASHTTQTYENLLLAIQSKGLTIKSAKAGVSILSGSGLGVDILAPVSSTYDDLNNYSAVIKLIFGNNSFLFMGDAESLSEGQITANVKADVLKVGHHGSTSSTSSAFLAKVSPKYAVIMCGVGNSYGHPHAETLAKLQSTNVVIYRTDLNSTIIFTSDGTNLTVKTTKSGSSTGTTGTAATTIKQTDTPTTNTVNIQYIGNLNSHKFHLPSCRTLPEPQNRIYFNTRDGAISAGYVPCKNCNP